MRVYLRRSGFSRGPNVVSCSLSLSLSHTHTHNPAFLTHTHTQVSIDGGDNYVRLNRTTDDPGGKRGSFIDVSYKVCCLYAPLAGAYLIMLLPVLLVGLGCTICFLYVMTKSPREMPEVDFADEPKMPRLPSMAMTLVSSPVAVKLEYVPKSVPPPKEEKKKWDTVATGTYMRDGQHTAVKWGKFGEAGGTAMNELDAEEEEEEEEEEVENIKLHEDIFVEVETPDIPRTLGKVRKSPAFFICVHSFAMV